MKLQIRKDDEVKVIAGSDKGRKGVVLEVDPKRLKIRVKDIRVQTKFNKKDSKIEKVEGFIDYSNVALVQKATKDAKKPATKKSAGGLFNKAKQ